MHMVVTIKYPKLSKKHSPANWMPGGNSGMCLYRFLMLFSDAASSNWYFSFLSKNFLRFLKIIKKFFKVGHPLKKPEFLKSPFEKSPPLGIFGKMDFFPLGKILYRKIFWKIFFQKCFLGFKNDAASIPRIKNKIKNIYGVRMTPLISP